MRLLNRHLLSVLRPNVLRPSRHLLSVLRPNKHLLNVLRLNVLRLNVLRPNVLRLNVLRLNVLRLNVLGLLLVAAHLRHGGGKHFILLLLLNCDFRLVQFQPYHSWYF